MGVSTIGSEQVTPSTSEFGLVYREYVGAVTAYFARRCTEPQVVADLVSETFVEAVGSFRTFDPLEAPRAGG